jgi:integral membrane protein (TIGR01906 family)
MTVTPILVVNAFRVLSHDWFVRYEIERDGFPPDRFGMSRDERLRLALVGLRSIRPESQGIVLLERAALPDGSRAFGSRELRHMADVRNRLLLAFRGQIVLLALLVVVAVALARSHGRRDVVPRGLLIGSLMTLVVAALVVPVILLGFDGFFLRFHEALFSGNSWRFSQTDTLLRLYPQEFWQDTSRLTSAIVVAQAILVAAGSGWWLRRLRNGPSSSVVPGSPA